MKHGIADPTDCDHRVAPKTRLPISGKLYHMTAADFRRLALCRTEAAEGSHFHVPDFRVAGKIFATLAYEKEGWGVLMLKPNQQAGMVADAPEVFSPVPNAWGRRGATRVRLANVTPEVLEGALHTAWRNRAPKRLLQARAK